jgi:hypothetical protein
VNQTFSIDDIKEEQKLNRFFITNQEIAIENILEDSDLLINNSEAMLSKIDNIIQFKEGGFMEGKEPEEVKDILRIGSDDDK